MALGRRIWIGASTCRYLCWVNRTYEWHGCAPGGVIVKATFCQLACHWKRRPAHSILVAFAILALASSLGACSSASYVGVGRGTVQIKTPLATPTPTHAVVTEFTIPSANTYLGAITTGPDNNLWVTECDANSIARVTLSGSITEFPIPTAGACPQIITSGPDGNLWFTEGVQTIGRITTAGVTTEFPLPPPLATAPNNPTGIVAGPDGNIWFSDAGASAIGVMSTSGNLLATYATPTGNSNPDLIINGPGGDMWFADEAAAGGASTNYIARITLSGAITEFQIPTPLGYYGGGTVGGLVAGQNGNTWFTEKLASKIGQVTPSGTFTEIEYATGTYRFQRMTSTPDGSLWVAEAATAAPWISEIGKMNSTGALVAEYEIQESGNCPTAPFFCGIRGLTVGPDNNVWFTDEGNDAVGYLTTGLSARVRHKR